MTGERIIGMTSDQTFVIVGASLAGAKAAETLREEGFDGRLVLIGAELDRPYERPPLSKDYLRGEVGREKVYVHEESFYADHQIDLLLGRTVVSLDTSADELALDDGERLRYDRLLLATGAEPRRLAIPGSELDGVLYLRSVADCDALRARLDRGGSVVVVGAGWIGCEVAAWEWACSRASSWPRAPASRPATASSPTSGCRRARPASSRPATRPQRSIRSTASGSASSTGPTRSSRGRWRR
jgi:hypothetical protein